MKLIEIVNNTTQNAGVNEPLILGSISRRVGCFSDYSAPASVLTLRETGYYEIDFKVNAGSTIAAQSMEISMFLDGIEQPETRVVHTGTAVDDVETLNTHKKIRVFNCSTASISFVNTGTDETVYTGLILDVKKVV